MSNIVLVDMNGYEHGIIYKIESKSAGLTYFGSTVNLFWTRIRHHLNAYEVWKAGKKDYKDRDNFCSSYQILQEPDCEFILLEARYDWNKEEKELKWRERWYYDNFECVNLMPPITTKKEKKDLARKNNIEYRKSGRLLENKRKFYRKHRDKIRARAIEKIECSICGKLIQRSGISKHKKTQHKT